MCLVDARRGPEEEEFELREFLAQREGLRTLFVLTKLDKLAKSAQKPAIEYSQKQLGGRIIGTSAEVGTGVDAVWRWVCSEAKAPTAADPT